jgi:HPt (histidine-containing phosphotransfer) domain-containing protein
MPENRMHPNKETKSSTGIREWVGTGPLSDTLIRMSDVRRATAAQPTAVLPGDLGGGGRDSASSSRNLPLIDPAVLVNLGDELGDASLARSFAEDFLEATSLRIGRFEEALTRQDAEDAMDAVLGIKATSAMAGAVQLAHLATECVTFLRAGDFTRAAAGLAAVRTCAEQTTTVLRDGYLKS